MLFVSYFYFHTSTENFQLLSLFLKTFFSWAGEKANGERSDSPGAGKGTPGSTRMLTRLRNPDSKLCQMKSQQVAAAAHEANKLNKENREVCALLEISGKKENCFGKLMCFVLGFFFFLIKKK